MTKALVIFRSLGTVLEIHSPALGAQLVDQVVRSAPAEAKHDIGDAIGGPESFGSTCGDTMCEETEGEGMASEAGSEGGSLGCVTMGNGTVEEPTSTEDTIPLEEIKTA